MHHTIIFISSIVFNVLSKTQIYFRVTRYRILKNR